MTTPAAHIEVPTYNPYFGCRVHRVRWWGLALKHERPECTVALEALSPSPPWSVRRLRRRERT